MSGQPDRRRRSFWPFFDLKITILEEKKTRGREGGTRETFIFKISLFAEKNELFLLCFFVGPTLGRIFHLLSFTICLFSVYFSSFQLVYVFIYTMPNTKFHSITITTICNCFTFLSSLDNISQQAFNVLFSFFLAV